MRTLIASLLLLGSLSAIAQSGLPPCPEGGTYRNNCFGAFTFSSGSIYTGEWQSGKPSGRGTWTWPDGANYVGEFRDGVRAGQGTFTFKDGTTYVGEHLDGKLHGQGTLSFKSGNRYVGEFQDNKRQGRGTFILTSGNRHVGEWRDNKRHGQGILYAANGSILESGRWDDDKLVQSYPVETADFPFEEKANPLGQIFRGVEGLIRGVLTGNPTQGKTEQQSVQAAPLAQSGGQAPRSVVPQPVHSSSTNSRLPPCPAGATALHGAGDSIANWNECVGTQTFSYSGQKYVGEYRKGLRSGEGVLYSESGTVRGAGRWEDGRLVQSLALDPAKFPFNFDKVTEADRRRLEVERLAEEARERKAAEAMRAEAGESERRRTGGVIGQSRLPPCPAAGERHNCFGTLSNSNGWRYIGEFQNGRQHGEGIYYTATGNVVDMGRWESGRVAHYYQLDTSLFPFNFDIAEMRRMETDRLAREAAERKAAEARAETERRRLESERIANEARERQLAEAREAERRKQEAVKPIDRRVAMVIGNSNYKVNRLDNPVNDATDMATALRGLGFEVTLLRDATLSQMRAATRKFEESVLGADVALIFYAGHGIEAKGRNYMIPVSADIQREYELDDQAYNAGQWLDMLEGAKGKNAQRVNIVILDACRDNSLTRSWRNSARGLGRMDAPSGTVLVYSTAPGKVAADGAVGQRNSPFTKHLLQSLQAPNVPIELVLRETRRRVVAETKGEQVPWEHSSLIGEFVFRVQR